VSSPLALGSPVLSRHPAQARRLHCGRLRPPTARQINAARILELFLYIKVYFRRVLQILPSLPPS
jgi:hypothetical protein